MKTRSNAKGKLFSLGFARAQRAIKSGFYLEAVSLCDSLMVNRIVAILCFNSDEVRNWYSVGDAIKAIRNAKIPQFDETLMEECANWARKRNRFIHGMAHLPDSGELEWKSRLAQAKITAEAGLRLANRLSEEAKKHRI